MTLCISSIPKTLLDNSSWCHIQHLASQSSTAPISSLQSHWQNPGMAREGAKSVPRRRQTDDIRVCEHAVAPDSWMVEGKKNLCVSKYGMLMEEGWQALCLHLSPPLLPESSYCLRRAVWVAMATVVEWDGKGWVKMNSGSLLHPNNSTAFQPSLHAAAALARQLAFSGMLGFFSFFFACVLLQYFSL